MHEKVKFRPILLELDNDKLFVINRKETTSRRAKPTEEVTEPILENVNKLQ